MFNHKSQHGKHLKRPGLGVEGAKKLTSARHYLAVTGHVNLGTLLCLWTLSQSRALDKATLSFHSENECLRGPRWDSKMVKKRETKSMGRESRHHSGLCYLRDAIKHTASTPFPLLVLLDGQLCPQRTVDISLCLSNCNSCVPGPWNYLQFYTSIFAWRASQEAQW